MSKYWPVLLVVFYFICLFTFAPAVAKDNKPETSYEIIQVEPNIRFVCFWSNSGMTSGVRDCHELEQPPIPFCTINEHP